MRLDRRASRVRGVRRRLGFRSGFLLFVGVFSAGQASAQFSMIDASAPRRDWSGSLHADSVTEFETDTDGGDQFDSWRLGVGGEYGGPVYESVLAGFHGRYQHAAYDFELDNGAFPSAAYGTNELPKEPWGGIDTLDLMPTASLLVADRFSIVGAIPIRWSGEVGSDRNGFSAGASALIAWQVVDGFRFGLGIGVTSQIESRTETFPIVALDWQISPSLRLATEGSWVQGGSAGLYWGPNPALALSLSVGYERNRFRLDDNGTLPDTDGIGEITSIPIEIGLRIRMTERAFLDLRGGLGVAGRFRVENDRGQKLYDQDYDPAPRLHIALRVPIGPFGSSRTPTSSEPSAWDRSAPPARDTGTPARSW